MRALIVVVLLLALVACTTQPIPYGDDGLPATTLTPSIGDIIDHPTTYEGKIVNITGLYGGWGHGVCPKGSSAMVTRSDWQIYDSTGCIYVGGATILHAEGEHLPTNASTFGTAIQVQGKVRLLDGKPVLVEP